MQVLPPSGAAAGGCGTPYGFSPAECPLTSGGVPPPGMSYRACDASASPAYGCSAGPHGVPSGGVPAPYGFAWPEATYVAPAGPCRGSGSGSGSASAGAATAQAAGSSTSVGAAEAALPQPGAGSAAACETPGAGVP